MTESKEGNGAGPTSPMPVTSSGRDHHDRGDEAQTAVHPALSDDPRRARLEAGLGEREAQLADAERTIAEAAGELGRRARRRVLEGRKALAEAHARLEREVAHAMELEAEIDRQITVREEESAAAAERLRRLEAQAQQDVAEAKAAGERRAATVQAALERTREAAEADMDRARTGFEEERRRLEIALADTRGALEEARGRLHDERASRAEVEERLATVIDREAVAAREAAGRQRELEASRAEVERMREEHARLRSELAAADASARQASEPTAGQVKPVTGPRVAERQDDGGTAAGTADELARATTSAEGRPRRRFGRFNGRAAELQARLDEALEQARAEQAWRARLEQELGHAAEAERRLRADLERLRAESADERERSGDDREASPEPGRASASGRPAPPGRDARLPSLVRRFARRGTR